MFHTLQLARRRRHGAAPRALRPPLQSPSPPKGDHSPDVCLHIGVSPDSELHSNGVILLSDVAAFMQCLVRLTEPLYRSRWLPWEQGGTEDAGQERAQETRSEAWPPVVATEVDRRGGTGGKMFLETEWTLMTD